MDRGFDARLRADGVTFEAADAELLRAIDRAGSLNAASDALGRSYSRAHGRLTDLEAAFGDLVDRERGGDGGGGSRLTDRGRELLADFERLRTDLAGTASVDEAVFPGEVRDREGELGTVETPAGRLRALVPPGADDVEVGVRSDAVTLQDPGEAPEATATSARNRFEGTVAELESGEAVVRVAVDLGAPDPLLALVTGESVDRLDLSVGDPVVATFKATATRATPRE